jgi:hypothetical protein
MEFITEKLSKHENGLTRALRKLLKQKNQTIKNINIENAELNKMILKQQDLVKKLNDENIEITAVLKNPTIENNKLIECNSSLKEQLLISQNQNSELLHNLDQARNRIKILKNTLIKNDI